VEPTEVRVRRAQQGDDIAFAGLVRDVHPQLFRWALVHTGSPDDAEDVAQAALLRMHARLHEFRHDSRFTTWLYAIVRRAAADWRRGQRRRTAREERWSRDLPQAQQPDTLHADRAAASAAVHAALAGLPARQREVYDMAELQAVPHDQVAAALGLSASTVRVHLLRARRTVRARLLATSPHIVEDRHEL
jgi:RNA polymerase sigma-70 factor (ECF subfamily)